MHEITRWTTSVCNSSLVLSTAGSLDGAHATSHWESFDLLRSLGTIPTEERVRVSWQKGISKVFFDFEMPLLNFKTAIQLLAPR